MSYIRNFLILLLYLIVIAYSLELLTTLTLKKKFNLIDKSMTEIREEKMNEIPNFDRRNEYLAFSEERETHDLHPSFRLAEWNLSRGDYDDKINNFMKKKKNK